uniref:Anaphylatoxin-like domain-containing protein n=1 Tax=Hucho hucho TaxID=62062 RepID=A0A4W5QXY5_9TELE
MQGFKSQQSVKLHLGAKGFQLFTNQSSTLHIFHLPFSSLNHCRYVMSAPNPLRVGSMERVFVEAQDYSGADFNVKIMVKNFPAKHQLLTSTSVSLNLVNKYQALMEINIPEGPGFFDEDYTGNQYVYLQAEFPGIRLEKVVLVSFQTGYIFVQTDKTIYTPESKVKYRVFALNAGLEPVINSINVEIMVCFCYSIILTHLSGKLLPVNSSALILSLYSYGNWKVVANFKNTPHKNFTADFEVKEYVLPSFEVKLTVSKSFFYVDDDELSVNIDARYLFGKPVTGFGFAVFGVIQGDGRTSFPGSLQRVELIEGVGKAVLKILNIKETFPEINNLLQKSLYISVNVLTDTGSEMVKAEKKGIFIVKSPYRIHFKNTPLYFKPGMPFDISVYVTNPDDSPATGINVEALHRENTVQGMTQDNGIARMTINTYLGMAELPIMVKTKVNELGDDRQGTQTMTAKPYKSKDNSKNYIHINIQSAEVKIKDQLKVALSLGSSPAPKHDKHEITYLILSKGQLISSKRLEWGKGQELMSLSLPVNKDMIPSFRIVAYYHVGQKEVVSDSVWVDVKDTCMGSLKVDVVRPSASYAPREEVTLSVIGDSEAKVGLVAVDNGVYVLNNKNRLTQTKIWDIIEKHDTGCTAGSGMDSMGVFYDAGLMFASNWGEGSPSNRTMTLCTQPRQRRSGFWTTSQYTGLERQCCMDGMRKNILDYTCERRAQYISDGTECVEAFLKCCREMATKREEAKTDLLILARSEEEDDNFDSFDDIISRSFFPESWLWDVESLSLPLACPKHMVLSLISAPLSILVATLSTSSILWQLSCSTGICVSEPLPLIVWKKFFVDLKLPYSAVRNEQLEIKAILHNYREDSITVRVELRETSEVCSSASKKGKYIVTVMVDARSTRSVPFVIIPMELGLHTIEVKASVRDWGGRDGIKKELRVVVRQTIQLASTIEAAISGGCGEQNMIGMTLPLIATHYLDTTKQWDKVGLERRNEAVNYIQKGYDQELAYRKNDGSYAAFASERSGTWLTAYVAKVFAMSNSLIVISEDVLCSAIKWLVMERQRSNGIFEETGKLLHPTMMGDVLGKDVDDTLTAFVLITMQEAHTICKNYSGIIALSRFLNQYLEFRNQHLINPYSVAMTSYALANEGQLNKDILFKYSSTDRTHWPVSGNHLLTLEATAYALLALVKVDGFEEAGPIVRWLKSQGFQRGGESSTQSTIMVFQAVAEYMTKAGKVKDIDLNVNIDISGRSKVIKWSFSKSNAYLARTDKVRTYAHISLFVTREKCKPIIKSSLSYGHSYSLLRFKSDRNATMTILDISLLTGFVVDVDDLKQLSTGTERYIQKFEMDKKLSERGSLIIYLDQVSNKLADKVAFRIHKVQDVGLLQPVGVTVYEYYNRCVKFYHPMKKGGTLNRLCQDDVCRCAEESCSFQKKRGDKSEVILMDKACEAGMDYGKSSLLRQTIVSLEMRSTLMFNFSLGTDLLLEGEKRLFLAHPSCRKALDLKEGQNYLIMGDTADLFQSGDSYVFVSRFDYVLGERTWIEYWPTSDECNMRGPIRKRCLEINDFVHVMENEGCVN